MLNIKNTLADTMSCLINIDPQIQLEPEPEGHEFGYYTFDPLPALEIHNIQTSSTALTQNADSPEVMCELPIDNHVLTQLQYNDEFCRNIWNQIEKGNVIDRHRYKMDNKLLKRFVVDGNDTYETTVIPRYLVPQVLHMAHDELGHNGTHRMYVLLKRLYYWKGLKPSVEKHIKQCYQCQRRNKQVVNMLNFTLMWLLFLCNSFLWI